LSTSIIRLTKAIIESPGPNSNIDVGGLAEEVRFRLLEILFGFDGSRKESDT
jgi:hypothetical protein